MIFFSFFSQIYFFLASNLFFCGLNFDFFSKFNAFPFFKGRQAPLWNSKKVKVTKNVIF